MVAFAYGTFAVQAGGHWFETSCVHKALFTRDSSLAAIGLLTEADICGALTAAATTTGMPARQITRTINRGLTAGQRKSAILKRVLTA